MDKSKIKENVRVIDRWYPDWGVGTIILIQKTQIKIDFGEPKGIITFDYPHAKEFLETEDDYYKLKSEKDPLILDR